MDTKIVMVALNGLDNILKVGEKEAKSIGAPNPYAMEVEECFGKKIQLLSNYLTFYQFFSYNFYLVYYLFPKFGFIHKTGYYLIVVIDK